MNSIYRRLSAFSGEIRFVYTYKKFGKDYPIQKIQLVRVINICWFYLRMRLQIIFYTQILRQHLNLQLYNLEWTTKAFGLKNWINQKKFDLNNS